MTDPAVPQGRVAVRTADGQLVTVAHKDLAQAVGAGATPLSQQEAREEVDQAKFGGYGGQAAALGLGVARGATLGLSDYLAAGALGQDYVSGVKRANAIASTGGEFGGMLLPALLSAGELTPMGLASALGRGAEGIVGETLGEGLLAKGLSAAAGGAIEGGAMGAGDAISEDALGESQLTAEKLLAGAGRGALAGGALGFGLGAGGAALAKGGAAIGRGALELGSSVLGKVEGKAASEIASDLSGKYAYAATGARKAEYDALLKAGKDPNELGNWLTESWSKYSDKPFAFANHEEIDAVAKAMRKDAGEAVGQAVRDLDVEAKAAQRAELQPIAGAQSFIDHAEKNIIGELEKNPFLQGEAKRIQGLVDDFKAASGLDATDEQLQGLQRIAAGGGEDAEKAAAKLTDIEAKRANISWEQLHDWRATLDKKVNWADDKAVTTALKDMRASLEEQITTAASKSDVGAAYAAAKSDFSKAADLTAATKQGVAKSQANRTLGLSEQLGVIQGLMSGNPLMGIAAGAAQYGIKHYGNQVAASVLKKAAGLEAMQHAVIRTNALKETAIKSFFGSSRASLASPAARTSHVLQRIDAVTRRAANPTAEQDPHQPDPLVAPKTSFAYAQTKAAALQWLSAQAPRGAPKSPLIPTIRNPPSKSALLSWNAKADVFEDPIGTIGYAMKTGTLRADHVDALDAMYPKLATELRESFHGALLQASTPKSLPSGNKLRQLGILLRTPATPDQDPAFIASQQAAYQQQQPPPPAPSGGGNAKPSTSLATGEDELEST